MRQRNERGTSLVEAAIFAPIVLSLIMGAIMGSLYFGDHVAVQWASRSGARAGAVGGNDGFADYDVLQAIKGAMVVLPTSSIDRIVVYRTDGYAGSPSDACKYGSAVGGNGIGSCNVYKPADLNRPGSDFGPSGWFGDDNWLATVRGVNGYTGTDYLGVYIRAKCTCGAQMFGADGTLESQTVNRLEAKTVS